MDTDRPAIGDINIIAGNQWRVSAIGVNVIVYTRADVIGEPANHFQILTISFDDYQAIQERNSRKVLKCARSAA